jgi:UDP-N-acetylglucosamine 1-carboxyvinyltransferase
MEAFSIDGGRPLQGDVQASGAKNAALPIMAAAILAEGPICLDRVPQLADVNTLACLLRRLGMAVTWNADRALELVTHSHAPVVAGARLVHRMRASFCVLGPLLARRGRATVALPGGCRIGPRPVDLHLMGLSRLGAELRLEAGYVAARARRLQGADIDLSQARVPTVTGTANLMCAATLARGRTVICGAAREPEIVDLGHFLNALGAEISGLGTSTLEIRGVEQLGHARHQLIPDRIEAGTMLLAAAASGGSVTVEQIEPGHMTALLEVLQAMGCRLQIGPESVTLTRSGKLVAVDVEADAYPGLPTDLQAQLMAVLCLAEGRSRVGDHVFPQRLRHVRQLRRFGARIQRLPGEAVIEGVSRLAAADCQATDLRASAALVLAGLASEGRTLVRGVHHLDRGYEEFQRKLSPLGASIQRLRYSARPNQAPRPSFVAPL